MKICKICKKENSDKANYCEHCGTKFDDGNSNEETYLVSIKKIK